jgi:hypothetical protein
MEKGKFETSVGSRNKAEYVEQYIGQRKDTVDWMSSELYIIIRHDKGGGGT